MQAMIRKPISADSHITEPPNCYVDYIDPAFRDSAPRIERDGASDVWVVPEMAKKISLGFISCAGVKPAELRSAGGIRFEDVYRGGWDPAARLAAQDRDGVVAEIIYPSVGMVLCNHPDRAYQRACYEAYNRWIAEFCAHAPSRLIGIGQTALRTPEEGVADLEAMHELGLRGVMVPGNPATEYDYDD